jgi:hypothetical protein
MRLRFECVQDQGVALAAATTQRDDAGAAIAAKCQRMVQYQPGARGSNPVPQGNYAAFRVNGSGARPRY